ncbi:ATP-dependent zinc metalloprotease FtsH [Desulfogranum mediterraneum]|uniref:ATP-dependent zinc metalloprotease FtsH n=1 Tax=Desulfogranum mediterraneum TaxID=160661 RepID=UPI00048B8C9F|nr:ATP-dependent zinc metalloprotease FtsH [Desulfogranum mediterraneum]
MKKLFYLALFLFVTSFAGAVIYQLYTLETALPSLRYDQFLASLNNNEIQSVTLRGGEVRFTDTFLRSYATFAPDPAGLLKRLEQKEIAITAEDHRHSPYIPFYIITLPIILLFFCGFYLTRQRKKDKDQEDSAFTSKRVVQLSKDNRITFADVAGIPEVLDELREIVDFLKNTGKFSRLGASIPKGVLLQGPPGTGKTLLAKAIAGEAMVPFYSFSGSDFVEMFVGVGASRVRDLFQEAKKNTPCIIFIDEIDAVGAHRGSGAGMGGQEERGQTLNALLVEMDGFSRDDTIIILAATNRPDILDPALMRPGRFDRMVNILAPDVKGRRKILDVHARKILIDEQLELDEVARNTPGFTGAELANLVNEAALIAARKDRDRVKEDDFLEARDRIVIGVERKGFMLSQDDKRTIAYHEAGHAILAKFLPHADPIQKITIIPRGKAMGHIQQQPLSDRHTYTKEYLKDRITILMGGRAAEQLCLLQQSTGSEDDLLRATEIATKMVCQWGMNERLGPLALARSVGGFLGGNSEKMVHSDITSKHIDMEVRRLVETSYEQAFNLLSSHKNFLTYLADILLQTETLDEEEIQIIFDCSLAKEAEATVNMDAHIPDECAGCPAVGQCAQQVA